MPDAQRSDSRGKDGVKAGDGIESPPLPPRPEPRLTGSLLFSLRPLSPGELSRVPGEGESTLPAVEQPNLTGDLPPPLQQTDSIEDYTERQTTVIPVTPSTNLAKVSVQPSAVDARGGKTRVLSFPATGTGTTTATASSSPSPHVNAAALSASSNTRVQKLAPPSLVLVASSSTASPPSPSLQQVSPTSSLAGAGRVRKLSVVSPPVSPASPNSSKPARKVSATTPTHASASVVNLASMVSVNGSPQSHSSHPMSESRIITPVETIPIRALPPIKSMAEHAVGVGLGAGAGLGGTGVPEASGAGGSAGYGSGRGSIKVLETSLISPALPNGLESSRRTGNPSMGQCIDRDNHGDLRKTQSGRSEESSSRSNAIPAQNRVTCAVEIHRQRSVTPAGGERGAGGSQGGHKETML